jgi:hypothetical protein
MGGDQTSAAVDWPCANHVQRTDPDAHFIVSNHVGFFDGILFLGPAFRPLGKPELLSIPCLSDMCDVYDGIAMDRTRSSGMSQVLLENGNDPNKPAIFILPEGALTSGDYVLRFYLGAFLSDLPVQLVTIRYKIWGTTPLHHISSGYIGPVWSSRVSGFVPRADQQRPTDWVWPQAASSSLPRRSFFPHSPRRCVSSRLDAALLSTRITSVIIHRNVRVLALNPGMSVNNADSINATLHLRKSLTNLTGAKMNDVFAVQIFPLSIC